MSFFTRQLRTVIQWENPNPEVLFERWSESGDEINNASKLIVSPGQGCIFVYEGRVEGVFGEPGLYELHTANRPFFTTLGKLMQNFQSEHKVGIYFYRTAKILNLKWGTESLIKYQDPTYKFPVACARSATIPCASWMRARSSSRSWRATRRTWPNRFASH